MGTNSLVVSTLVLFVLIASLVNALSPWDYSDVVANIINDMKAGDAKNFGESNPFTWPQYGVLRTRAIAVQSDGIISKDQLCLLEGDFADSNIFENYGDRIANGQDFFIDATLNVFCEKGNKLQEKAITGGENEAGFQYSWLNQCGCATAENSETCCAIALREPYTPAGESFMNFSVIDIGIVIILLLFLFGLILVVISTIRRKGKWGINLKPVHCPKCGTETPKTRKPKSKQESLWGGWTCEKCGCKMDKWGNEIL